MYVRTFMRIVYACTYVVYTCISLYIHGVLYVYLYGVYICTSHVFTFEPLY